jgi:signal peptidase I
VFVTHFIGALVGVDGASMMPNLRDGERVVLPNYETWLHKAGLGDFTRGDLLVFKPPAEAGLRPALLGLWAHRPFLIKRLVGLPDDPVRVQQEPVWVGGQEVVQNFTTDDWQKAELPRHQQRRHTARAERAARLQGPRRTDFVMGSTFLASGGRSYFAGRAT